MAYYRPIDALFKWKFDSVLASKASSILFIGIDSKDELHSIKSCHIIVGGDHGQGAFQFVATLLLFYNKTSFNNQLSLAFEEDFLAGFIECKKDTYDVLAKTIAKPINQSLKIIAAAEELVFVEYNDGSETKLTVEWGAQRAADSCAVNSGRIIHPVPVELFHTGDLAYNLTAQGRQGYASYWCARWQWGWSDWQHIEAPGAARVGTPWDWHTMSEHRNQLKQAEASSKNIKPQERKGINTDCEPLFDATPLHNWLMGPLHTVDLFINSATDMVNCYIDHRLENRPQDLLMQGDTKPTCGLQRDTPLEMSA
jgi:hypothetical protein